MLLATVDVPAPWPELARALGLACRGASLPARVACPACGGRLTVYQDSRSRRYWHHCQGCRRSGDAAALAALAWGLEPAAALRRLAATGLIAEEYAMPENAKIHLQTGPHRRRDFEAFMDKARDYLATAQSPALQRLRTTLRLTSSLPPPQWAEGPGRLVGAFPYRAVREVLTPGSSGPRTDSGGDGGCARLFRGRGWSDVLVFPYYAAPGRLSGFEFVGRDGGPGDREFAATPSSRSVRRSGGDEAGLAGLENTETVHGRLGAHVVAVADPALAVRLQIRNAVVSRRPLPLVAWRDDGRRWTRDAWATLQRRRVVFWGWELTAALVRQAALCDGLISLIEFAEVSQDAVDHYIRLKEPELLLERAVRRAKPWREAVRRWADKRQPAAVESLLLDLEALEIEVDADLAAALGPTAAGLLAAPAVRTVRVGSYSYQENDEGTWQLTPKGRRRIADVRLRIDRIYAGPRPRYVGRILHREGAIPFDVIATDLERRLVSTVCELCIRAGLGRPHLVRSVKLVDVAVAFQEPEVFRIVPD